MYAAFDLSPSMLIEAMEYCHLELGGASGLALKKAAEQVLVVVFAPARGHTRASLGLCLVVGLL